MNPKTVIKGKIHYVGVNDRNKHLFEGMWPLPYGVSYNSYLIDDETVALVDTVDICYFEVYLRKIKSIIGCLLYTSPSPRDMRRSRMPSSA